MNRILVIGCCCCALLGVSSNAWASRRYIDATRGTELADVIAVVMVEEVWERRIKPDQYENIYRIWRLRILDCWKGDFKEGDELFLVDQSAYSTAAVRFDDTKPTLLYLRRVDNAEPRSSGFDAEAHWKTVRGMLDEAAAQPAIDPALAFGGRRNQHPLSAKPLPRMTGRTLYYSLREVTSAETEADWRADPKLADEARLLDMLYRQPADDPVARWRRVVEESGDHTALVHAIEHLPRPLEPEDRVRLLDLLDRLPPDHPGVPAALSRYPSEAVRTLPPDRLAKWWNGPAGKQWQACLVVSHDHLLGADALPEIQEDLEAMVRAPSPYAYTALRTLARNAPDEVKRLFTEHRDIHPLLALQACQALSVNSDAFGWPPFDAACLAVGRDDLYRALRLVLYNTPHDVPHLEGVKAADWRALAPWLASVLQQPDGPTRRRLVAFLRTLGVSLDYDGKGYTLRPGTVGPPLGLRIEAPAGPLARPVTLACTMTVTEPVLLAEAHSTGWRVEGVGHFHNMGVGDSEMTLSFAFDRERPADMKYSWYEPGQTIRFERRFDGNWFPMPGKYRIHANLWFKHDGLEAGRDAWVGQVAAPPVEITIAP